MIRKYRVFNGDKVVWRKEEASDEIFFRPSNISKRIKKFGKFHHFIRQIKSYFIIG